MNIVFVGLENQCSRTTFMIAKSRRQGAIAAIVQYHTVGVDRYLELICRISDIIWCGKHHWHTRQGFILDFCLGGNINKTWGLRASLLLPGARKKCMDWPHY